MHFTGTVLNPNDVKKNANNNENDGSPSRAPSGRVRRRASARSLRSARRRCKVRGGDLYVVRSSADGSFGESRPCSSCVRWLQLYGVQRVFYSTSASAASSSHACCPWTMEKVAMMGATYVTSSQRKTRSMLVSTRN
eukprot:TRINITY_DN17744_c0_g1_i2.p1 TRINITY_DN17744_c0_g1~~TRINITY_DN17744_c0_g1_i2.p1  ORF type:complete len:137 (+),score=22.62 TRINITY_DN17744_c0_g1_i2:220-630(+)